MKYKIITLLIISQLCSGVLISQKNEAIAKIPFEYVAHRILLKNISVNGQDSLVFLFDTGAEGIGLFQSEIDRLNLKADPNKTIEVKGAGGIINLQVYPSVNLSYNNVDFGLFDITPFPIPPIKTSSKIEFNSGDHYSGLMVFDSGNPFDIILKGSFVKYNNLLKNKEKLKKFVIGGIGDHTIDCYEDQVRTITFGKIKLNDISAILEDNESTDEPYIAHIGMGIIKRFNLIYDFSNKKLFLENNNNYNKIERKEKDKFTSGEPSIKEIIKDGDLETLKVILQKHPDKLDKPSKSGRTPLHYASFNNQTEIVKYLVEQNAKLDLKEYDNGATPLHYSVYNNNVSIAKILLSAGASISEKDNIGLTPIEMANMMGKTDIIDLFNSISK